MTCIVGLVDNGTVYIGCDSAGVAGWDLTIRADRKIFRNGVALFGFTSSFRMGQLLRYKLVLPEITTSDIFQYMATHFIDAIRDCLKMGGFAEKDKEKETGGCFLVGIKGHLYQIGTDYQIGESTDGFDCVGCGDQLAKGALFATCNQDAMNRINIALEAAEHMCAGVRRPFFIEKI